MKMRGVKWENFGIGLKIKGIKRRMYLGKCSKLRFTRHILLYLDILMNVTIRILRYSTYVCVLVQSSYLHVVLT